MALDSMKTPVTLEHVPHGLLLGLRIFTVLCALLPIALLPQTSQAVQTVWPDPCATSPLSRLTAQEPENVGLAHNKDDGRRKVDWPRQLLAHVGHEWSEGLRGNDGGQQRALKGYRFDESGSMNSYVYRRELSTSIIILALVTALFLGSAHALSPGHGKAMVAAYLIGSHGRSRDAVILGGIVTFTHVFSVIVLGLVCLLLSNYIVPEKLFPWIGVASGGLIFAVGYWMLARKALGLDLRHPHHGHHHAHGEHSDDRHHRVSVDEEAPCTSHQCRNITKDPHLHGAEEKPKAESTGHMDDIVPMRARSSWGSLVSLGLAGGMVPCPTALVVLLAAISVGRVVFGLLMIVFFSIGLGIVLISIGIFTVRASKLTDRFADKRGWIQGLPVLSSGVIMLVGIAMAVNSLIAGGIVTINF